MRRREFITLLGARGGVAAPGARAAAERMRRIGVLLPSPADHPKQTASRRSYRGSSY